MSTKESALTNIAPRMRNAMAGLRAPSHSKVLGGSIIMLLGSTLVSAANFAYNIAVARMLGPSDFSHAAAAVTLLMLASCINLSFQLVTAKFIARNTNEAAKAAVYQSLRKRAWFTGMGLSAALCALNPFIAEYLRLPSPWFIPVLALGMLFYVPLGVKRGGFQGTYQFKRLSLSLGIEAVVKLVAAVVLVESGFGVMGAVAAITASVIVVHLLPGGEQQLRGKAEAGVAASSREGMQAVIFFVGQVIINNVDILMVKHFFKPSEAGLYAAVALVGRLLYFATWMVTSAMFPIAAGAQEEKESRHVLLVPLMFVTVISTVFIAGLWAFPEAVLTTVFGRDFGAVSPQATALLSMNAIAMAVYSLAVVFIAYEMSRRVANTAWLQLVASGLLVAGIVLYHETLMSVIVVQQVLRLLLLVAVVTPFLRKSILIRQESA